MRALMYSVRGYQERELDEFSFGSNVQSSMPGAGTELVVPVRSRTYGADPAYWSRDRLAGKLLLLAMADHSGTGAGLPDWCGIVADSRHDGSFIRLTVQEAQAALAYVVMRRRVPAGDTIAQTLRLVLDACGTDSYPVYLAEVESGGPRQQGLVMPRSVYAYLSNVTRQTGWEWGVSPRVSADRLYLDLRVLRRLGHDYRRAEAWHAGVEVLDSVELTADYTRQVNHVVALGKADKLGNSPMREAAYPALVRRYGRRGVVLQFPEIADGGRLQSAARAALWRRGRPAVTVRGQITQRDETRPFELVRLGNRLEVAAGPLMGEPVRIMGWGWDTTANSVDLVLRHDLDAEEQEVAESSDVVE